MSALSSIEKELNDIKAGLGKLKASCKSADGARPAARGGHEGAGVARN
jgi:hypothetical protein